MHPQKERVWTLSIMKRSAVHLKLGRDTHPERKGGGVSCVRRSALWRCVNHTHRSILPGLCLPLANCLVSSFNLTGPWVFLKRSAQLFFLRWIPPQRPMGAWSHFLQGGTPFSFNPQELPAHVQTGKSSLTSGVGTYLSIGFIRAQLLPLALSLEFWGENKGSTLPHLTTPDVWPRGPLSPTSQICSDVDCSGLEATPMTLSYALSLVAPFFRNHTIIIFLESPCNLFWDMYIPLFSQRLSGKFNAGLLVSPQPQPPTHLPCFVPWNRS